MKKTTIAVIALLFCTLLSFFNCKNETSDNGIKFIPRDSYIVDFRNGVTIYRDKISKKVMNGYYIVGDSSKKWEEFSVKEGLLNGDYIVYHNNGKKFTHSKYFKGKLHGEDLLYYSSGKLKKFSAYDRGNLIGKVTEYYEGGQVRSESRMKDGEITSSLIFNETGDLISKIYVKNNEKIIQEFK
ncbi:toxin-antitoxin system YwqK family antitoxin, partial [Seonamhaeicola sp.]